MRFQEAIEMELVKNVDLKKRTKNECTFSIKVK